MEETSQISIDLNPQTTPILYTDNVFMTTNEDGLILNVGQRIGNTEKMHVVARIGMSREHAKKVVEKLAKLLALTEGTSQTTSKKRN
jgi:hypothetical protein